MVVLPATRRAAIYDFANRFTALLSPEVVRKYILFCFGFGVAVRVMWACLLSPPLYADGFRYFKLACNLVGKHCYCEHLFDVRPFRLAFYPPGYPLFLTPFVALFGPHEWVTTVATIACFALTFFLACSIAKQWVGSPAVMLTALLLAIWPEDAMVTGIAAKEVLLAALLTAALYVYMRCQRENGKIRWGLLVTAGLLTGAAVLAQPGLLLFPSVFLAAEWSSKLAPGRRFVKVAVLCVAMLLAILPWTMRNKLVLHHFVLVSTNGGSVFYRANNPKADLPPEK